VDEKSKMGLILANKTAIYFYGIVVFSSLQNKNFLHLPRQSKTKLQLIPIQ
jgi:hypothetical protein